MNIDFFRATTYGGFQKASHFQVEIHAPSKVGMMPGTNAAGHMYVRECNIPGRNMATSEIKYGTAPTTKQVYNSIPADFTVTFICDAGMELFSYFKKWQDIIHNPVTGVLSYPDDYKGTVVVNAMDTLGSVRYTHTMYNAFPENVADISMSYSDDQFATFQVTFSYTESTSNNTNSIVQALMDRLQIPGL